MPADETEVPGYKGYRLFLEQNGTFYAKDQIGQRAAEAKTLESLKRKLNELTKAGFAGTKVWVEMSGYTSDDERTAYHLCEIVGVREDSRRYGDARDWSVTVPGHDYKHTTGAGNLVKNTSENRDRIAAIAGLRKEEDRARKAREKLEQQLDVYTDAELLSLPGKEG